jgi:hypothetical protein
MKDFVYLVVIVWILSLLWLTQAYAGTYQTISRDVDEENISITTNLCENSKQWVAIRYLDGKITYGCWQKKGDYVEATFDKKVTKYERSLFEFK